MFWFPPIRGLICLQDPPPPPLPSRLILNQAEIIPTDRLSKHLQHMEITTFVVYMVQVCAVIARAGPANRACRLQDFWGYSWIFLRGFFFSAGKKELIQLYSPKGLSVLPLVGFGEGRAQLSGSLVTSLPLPVLPDGNRTWKMLRNKAGRVEKGDTTRAKGK